MDQASRGQLLQFPLNGTHRCPGLANQFAQIVRVVWVAEQPAKHTSPGCSEEHGGGVKNGCSDGCSQDGDNRIQNAYDGQR